jgi:hypothetical protein
VGANTSAAFVLSPLPDPPPREEGEGEESRPSIYDSPASIPAPHRIQTFRQHLGKSHGGDGEYPLRVVPAK